MRYEHRRRSRMDGIAEGISLPLMINGIIRKDTDSVLYVTIPVQADRVDIEWTDTLLDIPDVQSHIVAAQMFYTLQDNKKVCKLIVCYNVNRVITSIYTEHPKAPSEFTFDTNPIKKVEKQYNIASDSYSYSGNVVERSTKRTRR